MPPFTLCWPFFINDRRLYRGEVHPTKRRRLDPGEVRDLVFLSAELSCLNLPTSVGSIEYDDLRNDEASAGILLEMKDRQRYFEGQMANRAMEDAATNKVHTSPNYFFSVPIVIFTEFRSPDYP